MQIKNHMWDDILSTKSALLPRACYSCSFSRAVAKHNIFTRSQLGAALQEAYKKLPVRWQTLQDLGNFKELLEGVVRRVKNISAFRGFRVKMDGPAVVVEVKKNMHDDIWCGFSPDGKDVGAGDGFAPHRILYASTLILEGTPAYKFKTVDPRTIRLIEQRYKVSQERLPAAFPGGEIIAISVLLI